MADEKGNTPQDRRAVALSDPNERRHFIDQFAKDNPGTDRKAVSDALDRAATKIAPSEDRNALKEAVSQELGGKHS